MTTQPHTGIRYGMQNRDMIARMLATPPDQDGPVYMVNLMKYRARADYADGRGDAISGREADDRYSPRDILAEIGAAVVFYGDVERQFGGQTPAWERVGIVRYPSRAAFFAMQRRPDFREKHVHKDAGMEQTIVLAAVPGTPLPAQLTTPAERAPVLLGVTPAGTPDAAPDGGDAVVLRVEGEVIGDGRSWERVSLKRWQGGEAASAWTDRDGYALLVRPSIDTLTGAGAA